MTDWDHIAGRAIKQFGAQQQKPELTLLLTYLASILPQSVLEIGSAQGGLAWALMHIGSISRLVTVDRVMLSRAVNIHQAWHDKITAIHGDSTAPITVSKAAAEGPYDVVIIDGGHDWDTASSDWNNYARMAKLGGLVVVHDTQGWYGRRDFDVPELWSRIRKALKTVELVSRHGQEAGTGIVWASTNDDHWWDVL
jgi:predicted O-methyltransferase YrrM